MLWSFVFQIHMVTQLDCLIWVEVPYVKEATKQSSSSLELNWTFKINFKNSNNTDSALRLAELFEPEFQFCVPHFGALYLPNQAEPVKIL